MDITKRALQTKVTVHRGNFKVADVERKQELATKYNVDPAMLELKKAMFPKELRSNLEKAMNAVTPTCHKFTSPWRDGGWRIISTANFSKFEEAMRECNSNISTARGAFIADLDAKIRISIQSLGGMGDITDYPSADYIRERFSMEVSYEPLSSQSHIVIDASQEVIDTVKKSMEENSNRAMQRAMQDVWDRVVIALDRAHERLSLEATTDKDGNIIKPKIFGSIVGNIHDLIDLLPGLNITEDPHLEKIRQELEKKFANLTIEDIKNDDNLRRDMAKEAGEILSKVKGVL